VRHFGLIGFPLSHSFSQGYFKDKFEQESILDAQYLNYPIASIHEFSSLWTMDESLAGLNVTIPYKKEVIPFLQFPSTVVKSIHACNCIRKFNGALYGYNTDVIGFEHSLLPFLKPYHTHALLLGTGGASAAVAWVLQKLNIKYQIVSRAADAGKISYDQVTPSLLATHTLIINTSPLGMYPKVNEAPALPYEAMGVQHHLYDLVYNPSETLFLQKGKAQGASIQNGLAMLHIQAEKSWEIWNAVIPIEQ
jgi:shikimate dehydrogenase